MPLDLSDDRECHYHLCSNCGWWVWTRRAPLAAWLLSLPCPVCRLTRTLVHGDAPVGLSRAIAELP